MTTSTAMGHARDAMELGDEAGAERWLRQAMQDEDTAEEAAAQLESLLLARAAAVKDEDPKAAVAIWRDVLGFAPHSTQARTSMARVLMRAGEFDEALGILQGDEACSGCRMLAAVVLYERGADALSAGRWSQAAQYLDEAFIAGGDPNALLMKTEAYTKGGHGTANEAIIALQQALSKMDKSQPGQLNSYVAARRAIAVRAATSGDISGVEQALILQDPRGLDLNDGMVEDFSLRLAVAQGEIDGGYYDEGVRRAAGVFIDARQTEDPVVMERVRTEMVNLFALRAAELIKRGKGKEAAEGLEPALRVDPDNHVIRFQQILAVAIYSSKKAKKMFDRVPEDTPGYERALAVYYTIRAREYLEAGQFTAAGADINRARKLDQNLLEVRLARAEYMAATRFQGLTKQAAQEFRELGEFKYPENRINRYGEALGQLAFIHQHWDDAAKNDPLRGPQFEDRMATLEANIKGFYPYGVDWRADHKAQLVFGNEGEQPVQIEVAGLKQGAEVVEVPPHGKADVVLDAAGYVRVATPEKRVGLFAEPGIRIILVAN